MHEAHDPRGPQPTHPQTTHPQAISPQAPPHEISREDIAWLARVFAGRSAAEIAQMKAVLDAFAAAAPPPAMPERDQLALLDVTDDLDHLRALFTALDMALADLQNRDSRSALRTLSDTILTRLRTIRGSIERIRRNPATPDGEGSPPTQ